MCIMIVLKNTKNNKMKMKPKKKILSKKDIALNHLFQWNYYNLSSSAFCAGFEQLYKAVKQQRPDIKKEKI